MSNLYGSDVPYYLRWNRYVQVVTRSNFIWVQSLLIKRESHHKTSPDLPLFSPWDLINNPHTPINCSPQGQMDAYPDLCPVRICHWPYHLIVMICSLLTLSILSSIVLPYLHCHVSVQHFTVRFVPWKVAGSMLRHHMMINNSLSWQQLLDPLSLVLHGVLILLIISFFQGNQGMMTYAAMLVGGIHHTYMITSKVIMWQSHFL